MQKLVTASQIRSHEQELIKKNGKGFSLELMERAGTGLANAIENYKDPYLFVCGKGNNGGDGFVAIRHLLNKKKKVNLFLACNPEDLSEEASFNFKLIADIIPYKVILNPDNDFTQSLQLANTVVDCLLGTGSKKDLSLAYKEIVNSINKVNKTVIACDVPTGLNAETGEVQEVSIKATKTITFAQSKVGLHLFPGREKTGKIKVIDIGIPEINSGIYLLDKDYIKEKFPDRPLNSNKGVFGRTFIIAGSKNFPGAAFLASRAASKIGSGLTSLSSPKEVFNQITTNIPEVIHVDFQIESILNELNNSTSIVIGPGLSICENSSLIIEEVIKNSKIPVVLDADGINVLEGKRELLKKVNCEVTITPHPKEFSRLTGISLSEVLKNKLHFSKIFSEELNCNIVLKGAGSIICTKDGEFFISPFANSGLAKGGTGDVLSGLIGGLISQGVKPSTAACIGVFLHGETAEIITKEKTEFSLLPEDLINYLPKAIQFIFNKEEILN